MRKLVKIECKTCKKKFLPKSERNVFCTRKCFKKDFYHRKKELENDSKFPIFVCPSCKHRIELDFDPVKYLKRWEHFACPFCNILMINITEYIITQDLSISN